MITAQVTEAPISVETLAASVKSDRAGAIVTFSGDVRNHDKGKEVAALSYEIHPSAPTVIRKITEEVCAKYEVVNVAVAHRCWFGNYRGCPTGSPWNRTCEAN